MKPFLQQYCLHHGARINPIADIVLLRLQAQNTEAFLVTHQALRVALHAPLVLETRRLSDQVRQVVQSIDCDDDEQLVLRI